MITVMSRGNSIIASVVLIGILGTLSIALQATTPSTRTVAVLPGSQGADALSTVISQKAQQEAPQEIGCFEGIEYKVRKVNNKTEVTCRQNFTNGNGCQAIWDEGVFSKAAYTKGGAEKCIQVLDTGSKIACYEASSDKCNLWHCFTPKNSKTETCVKVRNGKFERHQGFSPAANEDFALRQLVADAAGTGETAAESQNLLKALKSDSGTQAGVDRAFSDMLEEQKGRVEAGKQALIDCVDRCPQPAGLAAEKWLKDEQEKLQKMTVLNDELKKVASLDPSKGPGKDNQDKGGNGGAGNGQGQGGGGGGGQGGGQDNQQKPPTTGFGQPSGSGSQQKPTSSGSGTSNPYQQCSPQHFCTNNTLYWGSPQGQQQASYYPYYGSGCQNQVVQYCQYGCAQGGTTCSQNPQNSGQTPVATLSCGGSTATTLLDVGTTVPITFSCTNAATSAGSGFSTGGALTGSASATIQKPPSGANTVSYGLTCTASNNQTASARCDVGINVTSIVIVANPKQVAQNASTTIGWVTRGMKECVIQADDASGNAALETFNSENAGNTAVSGVATTPGLSAETTFTLACKTKADQTKSAAVTVKVE